jgi:cytochrome c oxidase subunit IV
MSGFPNPPLSLVVVWLTLLALAALSFALSFMRLGAANAAVALVIAALMVGTVALGLMKLARAAPLVWVFAGVGLFWLSILFGLSATDYGWRAPPGIASSPALRPEVPPVWQSRTGTAR